MDIFNMVRASRRTPYANLVLRLGRSRPWPQSGLMTPISHLSTASDVFSVPHISRSSVFQEQEAFRTSSGCPSGCDAQAQMQVVVDAGADASPSAWTAVLHLYRTLDVQVPVWCRGASCKERE